MKIVQRSSIEIHVEYRLFFQRKGETVGTGLSFECDREGKVKDGLPIAAQLNLRRARLNIDGVYLEPHLERFESSVRRPAIGLCECGCTVELAHFTNTCAGCNRDYNMSGQRLAPREQWGEETGEHWTECY